MPEDEKEVPPQQLTEDDLQRMTDDELEGLLDALESVSPYPEIKGEIIRRKEEAWFAVVPVMFYEPWTLREALRRAYRPLKRFFIYELGRRRTQGKFSNWDWDDFRRRFHRSECRPSVPWWRSRSEFRYWTNYFYVVPFRIRLNVFIARWQYCEYHGLMPRKIVRWLDARAERRAAK